MLFLEILSGVVFTLVSLIFICALLVEGTKSREQRWNEELIHQLGDALGKPTRRTYMCPRMYFAVLIWIASGTLLFW